MTGTTLSHYRITAELGRGGMGIVYRAEDTKLDRTVALKVLPAAALSSSDDRARFYREAKAVAQLHHPNIASVFEIDEAAPENGPKDDIRPFIAMEFIEGATLEDRIREAPLKLEDAVRIAQQVADALKAAHGKDIVHRDIKSANIMLSEEGRAKVLDFGLAKTVHSTMLTRMGSTLGTIAYMSPEQARGEDVDHRTDLWALGVVMYEMIAGRLPFGGDYEQAVTYSILNEDPEPLTAVRTGVPMGLEWIVSKLLSKKAADRYQTATDLMVDLRTVDLKSATMSRVSAAASGTGSGVGAGAASGAASGAPMPTAARPKRNPLDLTGRLHPAVLLGIVLLAAVIGFTAGGWGRSSADKAAPSGKRIMESVPVGDVVAALDISPQGDMLALATDVIHIKNLTDGSIRTYDEPDVYVHLAFSDDGDELLITTATDIKRMTVSSGAVVGVIDPREGGPRAEWIDDDRIIFEENTTLYTMSLSSGAPRQLIELDSLSGEYDVDWSAMLPDGRTVMATVQTRGEPDRIGFFDLETGRNKGYLDYPAGRAQWVDGGYLVFGMDGDLMALPFDPDRLEPTGPVQLIDRNVGNQGISVSKEGTLVHAAAQVGVVANQRPILPVVFRNLGSTTETILAPGVFPPGVYGAASVHPSGSMAAVTVFEEATPNGSVPSDIYILDFENQTRRALTRGGTSAYPAWSSDGDSLYYIENGENDRLMIMAANGRGASQVLAETAIPHIVDLDVSPDGRWAVFAGGLPPTIDQQSGLGILDLTAHSRGALVDRRVERVRAPNGNARHFAVSPSSRYLAFEDQGGIYVQSLEDQNSTPYMVWQNGMQRPKWGPDEEVLYASTVDGVMRQIRVQPDPVFATVGQPEEPGWLVSSSDFLDIFPDGERFLTGNPDPDFEMAARPDDAMQTLDIHYFINVGRILGRNGR